MKNNLENQDIKTDKPLALSYAELKASHDALEQRFADVLAENAAMSGALDGIRVYSSDTLSGPSEQVFYMTQWFRDGIKHIHGLSEISIPSTDAALAAIEARGVEKFAAWASAQESMASGAGDKKEARIYCQVEARAKHFAIELREATNG